MGSWGDAGPGPQRHPRADRVHLLQEKGRPGEFMPISEDEHGTYIMNSRDLRAGEHVQRRVQSGVDCLKIEGRTKSHYYTARTTRVYRRAIDDAVAGQGFRPALMEELESLSNRGYTDGFYQRHETHELQNYRDGASRATRQQFVAEVTGFDSGSGLTLLEVKNRFSVGDELELITPAGRHRFRLRTMQDLQGEPLQVAPGAGWRVRVPLPAGEPGMGLVSRVIEPSA